MNLKYSSFQFSNAEIVAILLYTHVDQELYRDLRKSMTERLVCSEKDMKLEQGYNKNKDLGYRDYLLWKMKYEKEARRKYRWPVL